MVAFLIIAYSLWAVYSGFRVLSGKIEWLDRMEPVNLIVKIVLSIVLGYLIGGFYLVYLALKLVFHFGS